MKKESKDNYLIDPKVYEKFCKEIQKMADKTFGKTDEGNSKVQIIVVDKTRYQSIHYAPLLYDRETLSPDDKDWLKRMVWMNMAIAWQDLDRWQRLRDLEDDK
jgi:hypothetical protein